MEEKHDISFFHPYLEPPPIKFINFKSGQEKRRERRKQERKKKKK